MVDEIIKVLEYIITNPVFIGIAIVFLIIFVAIFGFALTIIFKVFKSFNDDEFFNPKKRNKRFQERINK